MVILVILLLFKKICPWKNLSKVKVEIMIRGRGEAAAKGASSTNLRHSLSLMLLLLLLLWIFYLCCYHSNLPHTASRPPQALSPPDPLYWRQPKITKNNRKFISTSNMGGWKNFYIICAGLINVDNASHICVMSLLMKGYWADMSNTYHWVAPTHYVQIFQIGPLGIWCIGTNESSN